MVKVLVVPLPDVVAMLPFMLPVNVPPVTVGTPHVPSPARYWFGSPDRTRSVPFADVVAFVSGLLMVGAPSSFTLITSLPPNLWLVAWESGVLASVSLVSVDPISDDVTFGRVSVMLPARVPIANEAANPELLTL